MPRDGAITLTDLQAPFRTWSASLAAGVGATPWRGLSPSAATQNSPCRPRQLFEDDEFRSEHLWPLQGGVWGDYSALPFPSSARRPL